MNTAIERRQWANRQALRTLGEAIREAEEGKPRREFSPEAIIKWFFTWVLCCTGFFLAMTIVGTLSKLLKFLVPEN